MRATRFPAAMLRGAHRNVARLALVAIAGCALMLAATAPTEAQGGFPGRTGMRIVHAVTDVPGIDVRVDGEYLFPDILYKEITQYRTPPGSRSGASHHIEVLPTGLDAPVLAEADIVYEPGTTLTIAFSGANDDIALRVIPNGPLPREPGRGNRYGFIRVSHLAPDQGPVDLVHNGEDRWIENVAYTEVSDFIDEREREVTVDLRDAGGDAQTVRVNVPRMDIRANYGLTVFLVGFLDSDSLEVILDYDISVANDSGGGGGGGGGGGRPTTVPQPTMTPRPPPADVRFFHALVGAEALAVRLDGRAAARDLRFGEASTNLSLDSGTVVITALAEAGGETVLEETIQLPVGGPTTIALHGRIDDPKVLVIPFDDSTGAAAARAHLRAVHLAPELGPLNAEVQGSARISIATGLERAAIEPYLVIPAESYTVSFGRAGDALPFARQAGVALAGYSWHTAFLIGSEAAGNRRIVVLEDYARIGAPGRPGGETRVRMLHASPSADPLSLIVGELEAIKDLSYRQATDYRPWTAEGYDLRVEPSDARGRSLASTAVTLEAGHSTSLLVLGRNSQTAIVPLDDDLSRPANGLARLRFVHAAPEAPSLRVARFGAGGTVLDERLGYGLASETFDLPTGFVGFTLRGADGGPELGRVEDVWLKAGAVYSVIVLPGETPGTLDAWVLRDASYPDAPPSIDVVGRLFMPIAVTR